VSDSRPSAGGTRSEPFDARDLRQALGTFATGVTIVTTLSVERSPIGFTCNSFNSVSLAPPLVLWSLSLRSPNLENFLQARHFAVNVLAHGQVELARRFARSGRHKFDGIRYSEGIDGIPILEGTAAQLECRNETRYYSGDHVIFIGHVLRYAYRTCVPLVFYRGQYGGIAPADDG
jgi:flavin reductase (DIM6/NTAB) family NADH-FMN oxidoreductase RutF